MQVVDTQASLRPTQPVADRFDGRRQCFDGGDLQIVFNQGHAGAGVDPGRMHPRHSLKGLCHGFVLPIL